MVEIAPQRRGHLTQIAFDHLKRHTIACSIAPGKIGIDGLKLQPCQNEVWNPRGKAQRRRPGPAAQIQHAIPGFCRTGGGQQHRVGCRPVALRRLPQPQPPAKKFVIRQLIFGKHQRPGSIPLSRSTACAINTSRSATIRRCGNIPRLPSRMLMWTSR